MMLWQLLLLGISLIAAILIGPTINFGEQWKIFEALKGSGEVLFAIIGVWLSIVYPDVLKDLHATKSLSEIWTEKNKFLKLIFPAMVSMISIVLVILLQWLAPIGKAFPFLIGYKSILRGGTFFLISLLTLEQITAFFVALIPLGKMEFDTRQLAESKQEDIDRNKLVQKENETDE